jgi:hypothetical protein
LSDHDRQVATAAQSTLGRLGCVQKGASQTWLDDHGWWVGVIEFQPSSWSKGSYLNVGACWLWRETDHFSFDLGSRVQGLRRFKHSDRFTIDAKRLAAQAARELLKLRARVRGVESMAWRLRLKLMPTAWDHYHAAVANGLVGKSRVARGRLRAISKARSKAEWMPALKERAARLDLLLDDSEAFRQEVKAEVARSRKLLGLPRLEESWEFDA